MRTVSITDDGTTTIELTDAEAHALRNQLPQISGSPVAHELQRHLAMGHGEIGHQHTETGSAVTVDDLAQLIHAADVHVNDGDYPSWDDLSKTPGLGQDDVRKAARWLLRRLTITHRFPAATKESR
jgi:hypothetical protein